MPPPPIIATAGDPTPEASKIAEIVAGTAI